VAIDALLFCWPVPPSPPPPPPPGGPGLGVEAIVVVTVVMMVDAAGDGVDDGNVVDILDRLKNYNIEVMVEEVVNRKGKVPRRSTSVGHSSMSKEGPREPETNEVQLQRGWVLPENVPES
jgi:hypothetical protein